jgi:hypothetical protein
MELTKKSFPPGDTFLRLVQTFERRAEHTTRRYIPKAGTKLPRCYAATGVALALLDTAASCGWGCRGGDHRAEFFVARAVSTSYAALRLIRAAYYDESLSLVRAVGEVANAIALFVADTSKFDRWKSLSESDRRKEFSAVKVRLALEKVWPFVPISEERYRALSGFSIHTGPNSLPQAHNSAAQAMTVPRFQEAGLAMALNELAIALGFVAICTPSFLTLRAEHRQWLIDAGRDVGDTVGAVLVTERGRPWFKLH